jgi:cytochrome c oxidase assembly factor CtaG
VTRTIAGPWVLVPLACAVLLVSHLPGVLSAVEAHPLLHVIEHAALFWSALAAWIAVLGVDPLPGAPGPIGLLAALSFWMIAMATIGSQYASSDHVLIAAYAHQADALADQRSAGLIMWLGGLVTIVPVAVIGSLRGMWVEEQRQRRRERAEGVR